LFLYWTDFLTWFKWNEWVSVSGSKACITGRPWAADAIKQTNSKDVLFTKGKEHSPVETGTGCTPSFTGSARDFYDLLCMSMVGLGAEKKSKFA
jgi:hypothetical protein